MDIVLRRCFAGHSVLSDFLIPAIQADEHAQANAKAFFRAQAMGLDRLISAMSDEYGREAEDKSMRTRQRKTQLVQLLLDGELFEVPEFAYNFSVHHLGALARGGEAETSIRRLASAMGGQLLLVRPSIETIWAWIGTRDEVHRDQLQQILASEWPHTAHLALGEPARGLQGWRRTHQQAKAAFPIALKHPRRAVRYADIALLAAIDRDRVLSASLRNLYLDPLSQERDGGLTLRRTLKAYFASGRNTVSAAALLEVSRQTVAKRLRTVEERIGRPVEDCARDLEAVLELAEIGPPIDPL